MAKSKKVLPRRAKTGIAAAPTESFRWFAYYIRMEVEKKDISGVLKGYIRDTYKGKERALLLEAPEYMYTAEAGVAATIAWKNLGKEWDANWLGAKHVETYIERLRTAATKKLALKKNDVIVVPKRTPMEIVKEKTSDFIACIEEILDMFGGDISVDWDNYSVYNEMVKADLNSFSAKHVLDYYKPLKAEIDELVNKKTDDLVEAYNHWTVRDRKKFLKIITAIVDDAEKYVLSKKAARKTSKPRVKSADKQTAKLNFAKDSVEFKLTSINPSMIVGATRLYVFNVKTRAVTEYVTEKHSGFEVKGSTIHGINNDLSRSIRLRKPEEHLTVFLTKTPAVINKLWGTLTTKTNDNVNGRINKDTIILRVLDK